MIRLLAGLVLLPLSASLFWVSAKTLASVSVASSSAAPFTAGLGLFFVCWSMEKWLMAGAIGPAAWAGRAARWTYVLGHELTHAMAAWATGGSVYAISVGEKEGHVDLSHSSAFVALAPYCFPIYPLAVAAAYRLLLWWRPELGAEALFLFLMGLAIAAHLLFTWDALTGTRQPDVDAAGGRVFSWSLIAIANALIVMLLLKGLFPGSVALADRLGEAGGAVKRFWTFAWATGKPLAAAATKRALE